MAIFNKWVLPLPKIYHSYKAEQSKSSTPLISNSLEKGSLASDASEENESLDHLSWLNNPTEVLVESKENLKYYGGEKSQNPILALGPSAKTKARAVTRSYFQSLYAFMCCDSFPCLCSTVPSWGNELHRLVSRSGHRILGRMCQDWKRRASPETWDVELELVTDLMRCWVVSLWQMDECNFYHVRVRTGRAVCVVILCFWSSHLGRRNDIDIQ